MPTANPTALFDFADELALVSSEVMRFRLKNKATLSQEEKDHLEGVEIKLDEATAQVRADGIEALGELKKSARLEVQSATQDAQSLLRRIKKVERAVDIASSVLGLALAAIAGPPAGVLAALKTVKSTIGTDTA